MLQPSYQTGESNNTPVCIRSSRDNFIKNIYPNYSQCINSNSAKNKSKCLEFAKCSLDCDSTCIKNCNGEKGCITKCSALNFLSKDHLNSIKDSPYDTTRIQCRIDKCSAKSVLNNSKVVGFSYPQ